MNQGDYFLEKVAEHLFPRIAKRFLLPALGYLDFLKGLIDEYGFEKVARAITKTAAYYIEGIGEVPFAKLHELAPLIKQKSPKMHAYFERSGAYTRSLNFAKKSEARRAAKQGLRAARTVEKEVPGLFSKIFKAVKL